MLRTIFGAGLMAVFLAGCGSITPAGLLAANRLNPLETPPGDIMVAVGVPEALRLQDGDATFRLAFSPANPTETPPVDTTVPLTLLTGTPAPQPSTANETIYVLGFSPQDAARVSATQARIRALKEQEIAGEGALGISVIGGCLAGDLDGRLPVSTWLRTDPQGAFVPLTRRSDLLQALPAEERAQLEAALEPC